MHIPNFSFFAKFGGRLCEEQTQKIRKNDQKITPLWQSRDEMKLKSRDLQKADSGLLPNLHIKFQLPCSIWRAIMRGTNSKNKKKRTKNNFLADVMG